MESPARHVYGPRPLGALVPSVTRQAFRKRSPAAAQVMVDWAAIVGPELARVAAPTRLVRGVLNIGCAGPVAMELQYWSAELMNRINTHLGSIVVTQLKFRQVALDFPLVVQPQKMPQAVVAAAEAAVADFPEGELRAALAALGRAVMVGSTRVRHVR